MSAINVGEVYYFLLKQISQVLSESWRQSSRTLPVTIEVPTMDDIWAAALLKGDHAVSYTDAFAAALAKKHNCPLVTGDPCAPARSPIRSSALLSQTLSQTPGKWRR